MKLILLGFSTAILSLSFCFNNLSAASSEMQALRTQSVSEVYETSKKAGFKRAAMMDASQKALSKFQTQAQELRSREFKKAAQDWHKNAKAHPVVLPSPGAATGAGKMATNPNSADQPAPRKAVRRGDGPGTGGMSAGASKGAEAVTFGTKKKE